jgi:hypothetical protein
MLWAVVTWAAVIVACRWMFARRQQQVLAALPQLMCPACGSPLGWVTASELGECKDWVTPAEGFSVPDIWEFECRCGRTVLACNERAGVSVSARYEPRAVDQQNLREAHGLVRAARNRRLTNDEYERVIRLLNCETPAATLCAIVTLDLVVARDPDRRDRAIAALDRCQQIGLPEVREEAGKAITRLNVPQGPP